MHIGQSGLGRTANAKFPLGRSIPLSSGRYRFNCTIPMMHDQSGPCRCNVKATDAAAASKLPVPLQLKTTDAAATPGPISQQLQNYRCRCNSKATDAAAHMQLIPLHLQSSRCRYTHEAVDTASPSKLPMQLV